MEQGGRLGGMKKIQARVDESVDEFIGKLQTVIGEYAGEAIEQRLLNRRKPRRSRAASPHRSMSEISALAEALYTQICSQPGETMMVLSQAVGHSSAALALPARKLVDAEMVKKTGRNATTRYFPVGRQPAKRGNKRRQGGS